MQYILSNVIDTIVKIGSEEPNTIGVNFVKGKKTYGAWVSLDSITEYLIDEAVPVEYGQTPPEAIL